MESHGVYAENNVTVNDALTVMAGDSEATATDVTSIFATMHDQKWVNIEKVITDGEYYNATGTENPTVYQGGGSVTPFTVKHSNPQQDTETFYAFDGIKMDQETQYVAKENYTAAEGSVVITLKPAYLDTLALGSHVMHVYLKPDSIVDIPFTLKANTASAGTTDTQPAASDVSVYAPDSPQKVWKFPKTGDSSPLGLWIAMTVFGAAGIAGLVWSNKRKKK